MRVHPLASAGLFIALSTYLSATTIVGIWTEKQVTIAADCKQTMTDGHTVVGSKTGCKVFVVRNMVVAFAGLAEAEQISVTDAMRNSRELVDADTHAPLPIDSVVVGAESAITQILKARHTASEANASIELIIAGMVNGKLQMYRIEQLGAQISGDYSMAMSSRRIEYPRDRGYKGSDANRGIEVIGIDDTVKRFQAVLAERREWSVGDDVAVARRLVAIEAADSRDSIFVGPPITTVVVSKNGIRWVNKGACNQPASSGANGN